MKIADRFTKNLTLQDYAPQGKIEGVRVVELIRSFGEESGGLVEIARLDPGGKLPEVPDFEVRQITYTYLEPGAIKAWHLHQKQTDLWFVPPTSRLLLGLVDLREDSSSKENLMRLLGGGGKNQLILVPPGVAHGMGNLYSERAELVYLTDQHFDPQDEFRLPWDYFGADFWQLHCS